MSKPKMLTRTAAQDQALKLMVVFAKAFNAVGDLVQADIAGHGLTQTEFGVLEALYHKGPMLLGEVQRKILLSSGGITYTVDRLAEKGLVERQHCPTDRRARYAALTAKGEELMDRIFPIHADALERVFSSLDSERQRQLTELLRDLGKGAEAMKGKPSPEGAAA